MKDVSYIRFSDDGRYLFGRRYEFDPLWIWETNTGRVVARSTLGETHATYLKAIAPGQHVLRRFGESAWRKGFIQTNRRWLPTWAILMSDRLEVRDSIVLDPATGKWQTFLKLPYQTGLINVFPEKGQALLYHWGTEPRLEWYTIPPGVPWVSLLSWSTLVAAMYWLLSSLLAWRRRRRAAISPIPAT